MGAGPETRLQLLRDRAATPDGLQLTCAGSSMEPMIRRGDPVKVRAGRPQVGVVAAFVTRAGELELHRLVAAAPGGWWAHLGDNQVSPSPGLVHDSRIIGIADVQVVAPTIGMRARAVARFARAGLRVARRRMMRLVG